MSNLNMTPAPTARSPLRTVSIAEAEAKLAEAPHDTPEWDAAHAELERIVTETAERDA